MNGRSLVPSAHLESTVIPVAALQPPSLARGVAILRLLPVALAAVLAIAGLTTIWGSVMGLWSLWMTDALKSIGMVIPVVSFLLVLRAWRSLGWELDGSWWGLGLLIVTAVLVRMRDQSVLVLMLTPVWSMYFPPHSLVLFAYGAGVALLFGGPRLARASVFPLVLLLFANPIPHVFNVFVDLPLQRASAHIARAFAQALGQPLTPDKLRLMFTPEFGMFIAPGCNGIRGSVTMAFFALIAGYLYRFRWRATAFAVVGAMLLGYVFNLLRLCLLVLYYILALHVPSLQDKAKMGDYMIGGALFFCAVFLLYTVIERHGQSLRRVRSAERPLVASGPTREFYARAAAMAVLASAGFGLLVHTLRANAETAARVVDDRAQGSFPNTVGSYKLVRTWNENLISGALLFHWAEYAPAAGSGTHVAIGVSPVLGSHDTMICHSARGEDPLWHGQQVLATGDPEAVNFNTAFFNDGATQYLEATTLCNGASCGEYSTPPAKFGFVWSKPHPETLLQDPGRPIPILLRAETIDLTVPAAAARQQLTASVASFMSGLKLNELTQPYRRR